jgi:hypothetical protein
MSSDQRRKPLKTKAKQVAAPDPRRPTRRPTPLPRPIAGGYVVGEALTPQYKALIART